MSRGRGPLQRFIVETVTGLPDEAFPAPVIASVYAAQHGEPVTPAVRWSVRRAINQLDAERAVSTWMYLLPTVITAAAKPTANRWTMCVAAPGTDWEEEAWSGDPSYYESAVDLMLKMLIDDAKAELASTLGKGEA